MSDGVTQIDWLDLSLASIPMIVALFVVFRWTGRGWFAVYSIARMLIQLIVVGYFLVFIFTTRYASIVSLVLIVMLLVASWISLGPVRRYRRRLFGVVLMGLGAGGGFTLITVTQGVLRLEPWYEPRYMIPLAGMIFANSMNTISVAAERFVAERINGVDAQTAKRTAFRTGMIPVINSMFAVGLVALPGMMTGQVLSGVSPLIAARYQIMVMCMLFAASGISSAIVLQWLGNHTLPCDAQDAR